MAELSTMNTTERWKSIEIDRQLRYGRSHPVLTGVYDNWLLQKEYHPVLRGNEIKEYYQLSASADSISRIIRMMQCNTVISFSLMKAVYMHGRKKN